MQVKIQSHNYNASLCTDATIVFKESLEINTFGMIFPVTKELTNVHTRFEIGNWTLLDFGFKT